jgi:opacity protein-like surface antigen
MKRVLWILPAILLLFVSVAAHAQAQAQPQTQTPASAQSASTATGSSIPEWEIAGGYSFMRANFNGAGPSFNLNGGFGSLTENMNSWFGGRFEFNAWQGALSGFNVTAETFTYGPVFSYRKIHGFTPFAHIQFGAIHASTGYLGISESENKFAMTGGGGLDFHVGKRAAIRFQADYLYTRFLSVRENNIQANVGLVIYLGKIHHTTYPF